VREADLLACEAEDLALRGRVALKTVRPEIAADPQALDRFRREIALARIATHPHVFRIYDVGSHRPGATDGGGPVLLFLTMELLPGETLSALIARRNRLKRTEAVAILKQVAAGLDAAHSAGVVHRDFKGFGRQARRERLGPS
jgi:serine/threonine protein kinase